MDKVHLYCIYIHSENGRDVTANYKSTKHSHNIANPIVIANILVSEIQKEVGHIVKDFVIVGKEPVTE